MYGWFILKHKHHRIDFQNLMLKVQQGDQEAFSNICKAARPFLRTKLKRHFSSHEDVEDLIQLTLLNAWKIKDQYTSEKSSVLAWLAMIAKSKANDHLRKMYAQKRIRPRDFDQDHTLGDAFTSAVDVKLSAKPIDSSLDAEMRDSIERLISGFDPVRKEIFHRMYFLGHSKSEIAIQLGIPEGTIGCHLYRGLKELRQGLPSSLHPDHLPKGFDVAA